MAAIDFKEIPHGGGQDWEMFCREFLLIFGYEVVSEPSKGPDGGIDIKVKEIRKNLYSEEYDFYWLVSCKHNAHSNSSVSNNIEIDISDRLNQHNCKGFLAMYSTWPSTTLKTKLENLGIEFKILDSSIIEGRIVGNKNYDELFCRYFPKSYKLWKENYYFLEPVGLFEFYIEKRDKNLFKNLFGSNEYAIKQIRKSDSWEECCKLSDIKILEIPKLLDYYCAILDGYGIDMPEININKEEFNKPDFYRNYLHKLAMFHHNININGLFIWHRLEFEEPKILYGYPNSIILVDKNYNEYLKSMFNELKSLIG